MSRRVRVWHQNGLFAHEMSINCYLMDKDTETGGKVFNKAGKKVVWTIVLGAIVGALLGPFIGAAPGSAVGAMIVTLAMKPVSARPGSLTHLWQTLAIMAAAFVLSLPLRLVVFWAIGLFHGTAL